MVSPPVVVLSSPKKQKYCIRDDRRRWLVAVDQLFGGAMSVLFVQGALLV